MPLNSKAINDVVIPEANGFEEQCELERLLELLEIVQGSRLFRDLLRLDGFYFREINGEDNGEEILHIRIKNISQTDGYTFRLSTNMIETEVQRSVFDVVENHHIDPDSFTDIRLPIAKGELPAGEYTIVVLASLEWRTSVYWTGNFNFIVTTDGGWIWENNVLIEVDIEELERIEAQRPLMDRLGLSIWQRILVIIVLLIMVILVILLSTRKENAIAQGLRRKSIFRMGVLVLPLGLSLAFIFLTGFDIRNVLFLIVGCVLSILMIPLIKMKWKRISQNDYMKEIKEFADQSTDPWKMMKRLEVTWKKGEKITIVCRMDDEFLLFGDGITSGVVRWQEVEKVEVHMDVSDGVRSLRFGKSYIHDLVIWMHLKNAKPRHFPIASVTLRTKRAPKYFDKITKKLFDNVAKYHPGIVLEKPKT